jgi:hypothetical protein
VPPQRGNAQCGQQIHVVHQPSTVYATSVHEHRPGYSRSQPHAALKQRVLATFEGEVGRACVDRQREGKADATHHPPPPPPPPHTRAHPSTMTTKHEAAQDRILRPLRGVISRRGVSGADSQPTPKAKQPTALLHIEQGEGRRAPAKSPQMLESHWMAPPLSAKNKMRVLFSMPAASKALVTLPIPSSMHESIPTRNKGHARTSASMDRVRSGVDGAKTTPFLDAERFRHGLPTRKRPPLWVSDRAVVGRNVLWRNLRWGVHGLVSLVRIGTQREPGASCTHPTPHHNNSAAHIKVPLHKSTASKPQRGWRLRTAELGRTHQVQEQRLGGPTVLLNHLYCSVRVDERGVHAAVVAVDNTFQRQPIVRHRESGNQAGERRG